MDTEIERRQKKKISVIFAQDGEPYFRRLETDLLKELALEDELVVSCGGGAVCNEENLRLLKSSGMVVNLSVSAEIACQRTKNTCARPLLNVPDPLKAASELLAKRQPFYSQAHFNIDTESKSPEAVADEIIVRLSLKK